MRAESSILPDLQGLDSYATKLIRPSADDPNPFPLFPASGWPRVRGYDILSVIGSGGMGIVYKARHRDLRRTVAIKMLRGATLADPESRARFQAEAEAVARLQHPNIIQVFEIGVVDPRAGEPHLSPFISLEFVDGGSLIRRTERPQAPQYAAEMLEKLARAVYAIHQLGVIHRDLKPANVLLTQDGEPKIADFGLAKHTGPEHDERGRFLTQAGMVVGTPEYMAPEQAVGDAPTPAVDIYALGIILYELLTGRVPFHAATPLETMSLTQRQEPVPPRQLQPGLPRDLETICLKCLEKEPSKRYATAEALADDLRRYLDHRPIQARRLTEVEKLVRWCRRNPWLAASLGAVLCSFLLAFALVSRSYWRAEIALQNEAEQRREAEREKEAERRQRYRANIVATASALEVFNVDSARRTLADAPEEYRNWEWQHFQSRLDLAQRVLRNDEFEVRAAKMSPFSDRVVLCGEHDIVRVWDANRCEEIRTLQMSPALRGGGVSPDGKTLASFKSDGTLVLWDIDSHTLRTALIGHEKPPYLFRFSADSTRLVTASTDRTARVWNTQSGKLLRTTRMWRPEPLGMSISTDGRRAVIWTGDELQAHFYDLDAGNKIATISGLESGVHGVIFSPSGDRFVTIERYPATTLKIWNGKTAQFIHEMGRHRNTLPEIIFSPDGKRVASASMDQTIGLWDGTSGQSIATLKGHNGQVACVAFSPDSKQLVSGSHDHTLRLWNGVDGTPVAVLTGHEAAISAVTYLANGSRVVSASTDGTVRLWDPQVGEGNGILKGHAAFVYSVAFHPDGELIASASWDGTARIWNATTGKQKSVLDHGKNAIVTSLAFHPNGRILATRARQSIFLWDAESGRQLHRWAAPSHSWMDTRLAFSPKGDLLVSGCRGGEVRIWEVESRKEAAVLRGHQGEVRDVAFSPDGKWLASTGDKTIYIWDVARKEQVQVLEGHKDAVYCLAFNRKGSLLASGSNDGTARLWDTASWQETANLMHGANVYSLAFTPDGTRIASGCADNLIRLWDVSTHESIAELRGHSDYVHAIAFSPDGTRLGSASGDFTVRIWDTVRPQDRVPAK